MKNVVRLLLKELQTSTLVNIFVCILSTNTEISFQDQILTKGHRIENNQIIRPCSQPLLIIYGFYQQQSGMKKIIQNIKAVFLKKSISAESLDKGIAQKPMAQWKKNVFGFFALIGGGMIGVFLGQGIPDTYIRQIVDYFIKYQQLKKVVEATKHQKPEVIQPLPFFNHPQQMLKIREKRQKISKNTQIPKNDRTKEKDTYPSKPKAKQ